MERLGSGVRPMIDRERYNRHIILDGIGEEGQAKLLNAKVLLVGAGGLGSPIALYLAAAGVGTIGIVDADVVSLSNLQRQVLYTTAEVGRSKVECASARLHQLSPLTKINTYPLRFDASNAVGLVSQYDLVVDGCDNYTTRYLINDTCVALSKPYVYGTIGEFYGQLSTFNLEGGMNYRDLYPEENELVNRPQQVMGVMGVVPGIVGTMQAAEVIKVIAGCGTPLRNRLMSINVLTMETEVLSF